MAEQKNEPVGSESESSESSAPLNNDVSMMRDSDIKWRSKYKASVAEKEEVQRKNERLESEKTEMARKLESAIKSANDRIIQSELKSLSISEGIKDLDFLKLIDLSGAKINQDGHVSGVKEAIEDFKSRKPDLFGTVKMTSSSSNQGNVSETTHERIDALKMSPEEYRMAKAKLGFRR